MGLNKVPLLIQLKRESAKKLGPNVVPPGRPYLVAHIPTNPDEFEQLRLRFYDIMTELTYREAMAWCRAFNYTWSTFLMRKYQHRKPSLEEVVLTCAWDDNGRPVERKNRYIVAAFEQLIDSIKKYNAQHSAPGLSTSLGAEHPL
jgi:hypothetical protein